MDDLLNLSSVTRIFLMGYGTEDVSASSARVSFDPVYVRWSTYRRAPIYLSAELARLLQSMNDDPRLAGQCRAHNRVPTFRGGHNASAGQIHGHTPLVKRDGNSSLNTIASIAPFSRSIINASITQREGDEYHPKKNREKPGRGAKYIGAGTTERRSNI